MVKTREHASPNTTSLFTHVAAFLLATARRLTLPPLPLLSVLSPSVPQFSSSSVHSISFKSVSPSFAQLLPRTALYHGHDVSMPDGSVPGFMHPRLNISQARCIQAGCIPISRESQPDQLLPAARIIKTAADDRL